MSAKGCSAASSSASLCADRADVAEADPDGAGLDGAAGAADVHVRRAHLDPARLGVADERGGRVEAHRLRVQERAEELGRVVAAQPRRLVGEQAERGGVRLREPEPGEADELVVDRVRRRLVDPVAEAALDEPGPERLDRLLAPLAAHRAAEPFGLPHAEARGRHRDVEHLILEDDDAERLPERLAERLVLDRVDEVGVDAEPLAALDVGVDGLALDRPRADERDLDGQVVEVLGAGAQEALHLGAALDLEEPDGVGVLDLAVDLGIVERDPREVDRLAVEARDQLDGLLDGGEHPEAEQVDLEEAGVGARVLVPLADLAAGHRGGLHRDEVDQRPRRDHHPARVLGEVARQAGDLVGQLAEGLPARARVGAGHVLELGGDTGCLPAVGDAGEPLELGEREPERLADVADRAAAAVGREGRDERGVLAAVALGDGDDQLLADVAREVEVDVGHRDQLVVEEPAEREVRLDRVDVRQAGEVADDRADARAPPPPRRQDVARRVAPAHLERAGAGQLEHLPVEQEEPGEAEPGDQRQLGLEAVVRALLVAVRVGVAVGERALAEIAQLAVGRVGPVGEVGVAVAELLGQVEGAAVGDLARPGGGVGRKPLGGLLRARGAPIRGCRAARARSRRARCGCGSRRGRPGDGCGVDGERGRRRSRRSGRRARPRARSRAAFRRASPRSYGRWSST